MRYMGVIGHFEGVGQFWPGIATSDVADGRSRLFEEETGNEYCFQCSTGKH